MSFFEKFKSRAPAVPVPPKRIDISAAYGWPEDEFDEEDGDTYEVPPCERPTVKMSPRPVEDNVYIERLPAPIPNRQLPPPRPTKMVPAGRALITEPQQIPEESSAQFTLKKPPQVNRKDKPGKNIPPEREPPPRSTPIPVPAPSQCDEDVYLDPNEGQDDNDDLYLEPTEACCSSSQSPRLPVRIPPTPKSTPREAPPAITKPPVPRLKANVPFPCNPPGPDIKRPLCPGKRLPPTPVMKPPLPICFKPSPPPPPVMENPASKVSPTTPKSPPAIETEASQLLEMEWFAGNCDRKEAEAVLLTINKDGSFLVRYSSAQSPRQPYTLVVLYHNKVYNIPVRFLEESQGYALGKEGKKNEEFFASLVDIISHHRNNPILLIDSKSQAKHTTYLTHAARPLHC